EAIPADLLAWTGGRALIATGSPFGPVTYQGVAYQIGQANNALIFPGLGLGALLSRARRITDHMITAAAQAVAELTDTTTPGPPPAEAEPREPRPTIRRPALLTPSCQPFRRRHRHVPLPGSGRSCSPDAGGRPAAGPPVPVMWPSCRAASP